MAWPKIKNIVILILLALNLCLIGFTTNRQAQANLLQKQPRGEIIAFLRSKNIRIEEGVVPDTMWLSPMQVSRDLEQEEVLAQNLLEGTVEVESRGAGVYRYFNENGSIQFHSNGEFSARFETGKYPIEGTVEEHGVRMLEQLTFFGELIRVQAEGKKTILTYRESWKEIALLNCQVQLNYENGMLLSMTGGRRLSGVPKESTQQKQITVATALMRFYNGVKELGDTCTQIREITPGYLLTSTLTEPIPMTPVWQIVTDTCTYQLDTLSGQLNRIQ